MSILNKTLNKIAENADDAVVLKEILAPGAKKTAKSPKISDKTKDLLAAIAIGSAATAGSAGVSGLMGYGLGSIFPLSEEDYKENPEPSAWSPAWKNALGFGALGGLQSMLLPPASRLLYTGGSALGGGALGYGYGLGREDPKAKKAALAMKKQGYEDPLA